MTDILYKELLKFISALLTTNYYYIGLYHALQSIPGAALNGFVRFLKCEGTERLLFAQEVCRFLSCDNRSIILDTIPKPQQSISHPKEAINEVLQQDDQILKIVHKLIGEARSNQDYRTETFLNAFYTKYSAERQEVKRVHDNLLMLDDNRAGLYLLNQDLYKNYGPGHPYYSDMRIKM